MLPMPQNLMPTSPEDFWTRIEANNLLPGLRRHIPKCQDLFQRIWTIVSTDLYALDRRAHPHESLCDSDLPKTHDLAGWILAIAIQDGFPPNLISSAHWIDICDAVVITSGTPFLPDYFCTTVDMRRQVRWLAENEKESHS